ncbi:MAG TPA: carboxypeptidase regulatory-like domain-containing protein [Solirubrobacterales bacterium]|nr:carboxypeptidase regulatory-like domain-containing protein [Solirubrobacterales bacterium]
MRQADSEMAVDDTLRRERRGRDRGLLVSALLLLLTGLLMAFPCFALGAGTGQITGTVTDAITHAPVEDIEVCAYQASNLEYAGCGYTDSTGHYAITGLETRFYKVKFAPYYESGLNYVSQYYSGKTTWEEAEAVSVTNGSTSPNINAQLHEGGRVTGTVTDASTHAPIEDIEVCASREGGEGYFSRCAKTNAAGIYMISGIPSGSVIVEFSSGSCYTPGCTTPNYITQYYNGKAHWEEADDVAVSEGATTSNIDGSLHEGGRIAGKVTDATTHAGIAGISVCAGEGGQCSSTDANGEYSISGLPADSYTVGFYPGYGSPYLRQSYNGKAPFEPADTVSVAIGATTSNVNAALQEGGRITGKVTDASTHAGISGVEVCPSMITNSEYFPYYECAYTNASGEYAISALFAGSYKLQFYRPYESGYANQYYNGKTTFAQADAVAVAAGATTSNINAALQEGGRITGLITDATTHNPIEGIYACAVPIGGEQGAGECARSAPGGSYLIKGLQAGSYRVEFHGPPESDYLPQFHNGKTTSAGADPVAVTYGSTVSGVNAAMHEGGRVTGTVTSASAHLPIEGTEVCLSGSGEEYEYVGVNCQETDGAGQYTFRGLKAGSYKVVFYPAYVCGPHGCASQNYITQWYNGKPKWAQADVVSVAERSTTSGINAELHEGGLITGTVTDASTHDPIQGLEVCATEPGAGGLHSCDYTESDGTYSINGLASGSYDVVFRVDNEFYSPLNYAPQYYSGKASQAAADPVAVSTGSTTPNIDAQMQGGGRITGTITDASTHAPVKNIDACVTKVGAEEEYFGCGYSNANGEYEVQALASGSYKVSFYQEYYEPSELKYARQYYNGKATYDAADAVAVSAGSTTPNINAALREGGRITGTITDATTHNPLEGAEACAVKPGEEEEYFGCGYTDSAGAYAIGGLNPGNYVVRFEGPYGSGYAVQYYNGKASIGEAGSIAVGTGTTTPNVNAVLGADAAAKAVNTTAPVLSGTPALDSVLSCSNGVWQNSPTAFEYAWLRGSSAITGASAATYQVQAADQGSSITCEVTAINGAGETGATSNSLAIPAAAGAPVNTTAPVLSGTPALDSVLSCSDGAWSNSPTSFGYAWRRDGSPITGEAASGYTVQGADAGHGISCEVTAHNGGGSASATSNVLQVPAEGGGDGGTGGGGTSIPGGGGGSATPKPKPLSPKPLRCKRGFKKKTVKGKAKCVKVKRHRKHK